MTCGTGFAAFYATPPLMRWHITRTNSHKYIHPWPTMSSRPVPSLPFPEASLPHPTHQQPLTHIFSPSHHLRLHKPLQPHPLIKAQKPPRLPKLRQPILTYQNQLIRQEIRLMESLIRYLTYAFDYACALGFTSPKIDTCRSCRYCGGIAEDRVGGIPDVATGAHVVDKEGEFATRDVRVAG